MAQLNFNAATVAPDTGTGDPVPAGWYNVMMDESDLKPTKDGSGAFLACRFNILDGQYANRKLFARLNIRNANPTAQEIAYKQLSAICHAVGQIQCSDSSELHGKPLKVKVKLRPASGDYEASNDISAYKNINDNTAGAVGAPAGPAGFGAPAQMPAQQPWQPAPQQQMQQQVQQFQQPVQQPQFQQPAQQPMQQPAQAMQQPVQYQQAPQQQQPQQAPAGAPAQPWEQGSQQPWTQPQPQQQPVQQMQQQPVQQQQMQPAQQNPAVQQYAGATPPWQQ